MNRCRLKPRFEAFRIAGLHDHTLHTWDEAASRRLAGQAHKAAIDTGRNQIRWLARILSDVLLHEITKPVVELVVAERLAQSDLRIRFITRPEALRLLAELPSHLADMAVFSLATGLRASNVTGLEWSQIDLDRRLGWIHPDQSMARRAIPVPLNTDALSVIAKQIGGNKTHLFTYRGNRLRQLSTKAWYSALTRAGIENFRWHDLRHTWASWHAQDGTPLHALQELGGWQTYDMVRRYAHLSVGHLAVYANGAKSSFDE